MGGDQDGVVERAEHTERGERAERAQALQERTKKYALRVLGVFRALPKTDEARIMGKQLLRSATSAAANYRAACRARSMAEFTSKLSIVVEETDESAFWLELLADGGIVPRARLIDLLNESEELLAIFASARKTSAQRK